MAVALDPILAAAQANQSREPLCKISSCETAPSIPFDGQFLSTSSINEQHPDARIHSTGRLFAAFMVGPIPIDQYNFYYAVRYGYTDVGRTFFTYANFPLTNNYTGGEVTICELSDSRVGIVWTETYQGNRYVKYHIISVTGADYDPVVTGTIFTQSDALYFTGPTVIRLSDDSYLMVYGTQDGENHYHLYRRTSDDFITWSAASEIPLVGLDDTLRKANPCLIEPSAGTVWLLFDYLDSVGTSGQEQTNVYYVTSANKLATVSARTALTSYSGYAEKAEHPAAVQMSATEIYFAFDKLMASLHMDKDTTGWRGNTSTITDMHVDVTTQKLYVTSLYTGVGGKKLICVAKIDLTTWTIDKAWDTTPTPEFPDYFITGSTLWPNSYRGDGNYVPVACDQGVVSVLDAQADTIKTYAFYDFTAYGIPKNIDWTPTCPGSAMQLAKVWVDAASNRLYVLLICTASNHPSYQVGWIDLTAPGSTYTFTTIISDLNSLSNAQIMGLSGGKGWWEVNPGADLIIISLEGGLVNAAGALRIHLLSTGGLWKEYNTTVNPTFPKWGLKRGVYNNGIIASLFRYESLYGQQDYRGLCLIDLASNVISYVRPPWASVDDYQLSNMALTDTGEYLINAGAYGVTLFDGTYWTLYNNSELPGLTPDGINDFWSSIIYNPTTRTIIAASGRDWPVAWSGVIMFSRDGYLKQSNYRIGTLNGSWSWGDAVPLLIGYSDYEASLSLDPDDGALYAFWTNKAATELSIKWDKALAVFDLTPYIAKGQAVERSSTIDPTSGKWDAGLNFTISNGHLFDPSNTASLLSKYVTMGRKLQQQFGDNVGGTEYWEPVRIFTISQDGEVVHKRGEYPDVKVQAQTPRRRWDQIHIVASEYFQATPEVIIAALITAYANSPSGSISLGTWDGSATVEYQAVDVMLSDAIDMLALHFGYSIRDGAAGVIEAVKISNAKAIDKSYSSNVKLIQANPTNKYSSFVNRWTVECEEKTFIELLMAEELAAEFNASHRWNTGSKRYKIEYTNGSRIYRNPRLEVVQSVQALMFSLTGGCSEELVDDSHTEADQTLWDTYCHISVDSPDLTPDFIAALAMLVASFWDVDLLDLETETTIPIGKYVALFAIFLALNILGATGNFQYRIHGQPVVKARRKVSAKADDLALQDEMQQVIPEQPFQDPLCGSPSDCQVVADFRRMVAMSERARWAAEMTADLENEEGDTLSVIHPISGDAVTVFLTDLQTTYLMPVKDGDDGGFSQKIEGWRR